MSLLVTAVFLGQVVNPYLLDIGQPGQVTASRGYTISDSGEKTSVPTIAKAAKGVRFVLFGESHTSPDHHRAQAEVIEMLVKSGRKVIVGFEMFTRDNQASLAEWSKGTQTEADFIEKSNWKTQWGFDFALYKPIFDMTKAHKLPMVALNVPRDWVRQVGREGIGVLTTEQRKWVPDPYLLCTEHKQVFTALMGGHPLTGSRGENIYAAQVTWDEGMATTAVDYMNEHHKADPNAVMVIVVGSGHVMYGQGINYRIMRKTGEKSISIIAIDSEEPLPVSKGIGDFIFVSPPPKKA